MKNLVIVVAGNLNLHEMYSENTDHYDCVVIDYTKTHGTKYPLIYDYLINPLSLGILEYDNYLFLDDDIAITHYQIKNIFKYMDKLNLDIGSPSINPQYMQHEIMYSNPELVMHESNWVEICATFMSKKALTDVIESFKVNRSGYGLPNIWNIKYGYSFTILDEIEVIHTRPMAYNSDLYSQLGNGLDSAMKEFRDVIDSLVNECGVEKMQSKEILIKNHYK